jgi:hypothetical protein
MCVITHRRGATEEAIDVASYSCVSSPLTSTHAANRHRQPPLAWTQNNNVDPRLRAQCYTSPPSIDNDNTCAPAPFHCCLLHILMRAGPDAETPSRMQNINRFARDAQSTTQEERKGRPPQRTCYSQHKMSSMHCT